MAKTWSRIPPGPSPHATRVVCVLIAPSRPAPPPCGSERTAYLTPDGHGYEIQPRLPPLLGPMVFRNDEGLPCRQTRGDGNHMGGTVELSAPSLPARPPVD